MSADASGARNPAGSGDSETFVVATYNIHRCVGGDGREDRGRIAAVIHELQADVIALQEVDDGAQGFSGQLAELADRTGMTAFAGPAIVTQAGVYGNALLTRHPVLASALLDLSTPGREPRGAIDATLDTSGRPLRVVATHLGLKRRERMIQAERLLAALDDGRGEPLVVMGDMNEWAARSGAVRRLDGALGRAHARRSFPARAPLFALDRIWVRPGNAILSVEAHRTPLARAASDHLPLRAVLRPQLKQPVAR